MKTFVVILAIAAAASADISEGYHYKNPSTSYQTPHYSVASGNTGFNNGYAQSTGSGYKGQTLSAASNQYQTSTGYQNQAPASGGGYQTGSGYNTGGGYNSGSGYQAGTGHQSGSGYQQSGTGYQQSGTGYQQSGTGYQAGTGYQSGTGYQTASSYPSSSGYQTGGNYQSVADSSNGNKYQSSGSSGVSNGVVGLSSGSGQGGYQGFNQYQTSSQYQSNAASFQQNYNQVQQQPPQIFKHFYVHAAPEEPELARPRQPLVLPAPQKHYKIIFIKTPTPTFNSAQYVPIQQQNEEKTIVYVLVKKPETAEDIVLPQVEQKPPSKPEVYFIKYKGKEDSQAVIQNIVSEYNSGKGTVNVAGAVQSSGTLDSISDTKYTAQPVTASSLSSGVVSVTQGSSGSFGSQSYGNGGSTVGQTLSSSSGNTGSSGSFGSQSYGSGGSSGGQTLSSSSGNTGSSVSAFGVSGGSSGYQVSTAVPVQASTATGGYSGVSSTESSAFTSGSYGQSSSIPTNQGIPHETYGIPKFKDY